MKLINQPSYIVKKFTENFAWNHFGKIFEYFLVYIFSILIARRISVEDNGIFVTLISLCQILLVISEIGTDVSLNKSVSEFITLGNKEKIRFLFRKITLLKFLVFIFFTFLIYLFKDLISNFLEISNEIFTKYFTVLILYSGLRIFISTFINILIGQLNLKIILLVNIPARIIEVLSIYLFLNLDRSLLFIF
jgi:O-antigen/teichoic acid export membrane protein